MCRESPFIATTSLVLLWLSSSATLVFAHCLYSSFLMICENSPGFQGAIFIPAQLMSNREQHQSYWQLGEMWDCSSIPLCHTTSHLSHPAGQDRDSAKTRWFYHSAILRLVACSLVTPKCNEAGSPITHPSA